MTEEPHVITSQTFIDRLIEGEILSVESAQLEIASVLSPDATVDVLTDAIRMKITDEQLFNYLTEYERRMRITDKYRQDELEKSGEESREFVLELDGKSTFVYSSEYEISTPGFWLRNVLVQLSTQEQLSLANLLVNAHTILSQLCDGIDALDLCENLKSQFWELSSPSLFALSSYSNSQCLSGSEVRQLTIEYAEIGQTNAVAQIICDLIAHEGNANRFRETCEYYLQRGINSEEKQRLQNRELIPAAEKMVWRYLRMDNFSPASEFYSPNLSDDADPVVNRPWKGLDLSRRILISFRNSLDTDELVEPLPARFDDTYETPLMPFRGSPTSLDGLTPFQCLKTLQDAGLLNELEMRCLAVQFIEDKEERLNAVLCRHIDETNRFSDFDAYLEAATREPVGGKWKSINF